jgi:hypothetical protein
MRHRVNIVLWAVLLVATLLLLSGCEPMSAAELRREIDTIHSYAAEGAVLGDQVAGQRTKRTFARVQARELSDAAEHSAERLTDAQPDDGLDSEMQEAIRLAEDISGAIGQFEVSPDNPELAARAAAKLRKLAARTDDLAGSL